MAGAYGTGFLVPESAALPHQWSGTTSLNTILTNIVRSKLTHDDKCRLQSKQVSEQVAVALRDHIKSRCDMHSNIPQFGFPAMPTLIGSAADGTAIPESGADYDYLVPMQLPIHSTPSLINQGEGFWKIRMTNPHESAVKRLCVYSDGAYYLSPLEVHTFLVGEIEQGLRAVDIKNVSLTLKQRSRQAGPSQIIEVSFPSQYGCCKVTLKMDFVPCLTVSGRQLVGKLRPGLPPFQQLKHTNPPATLEWRESFGTRERDRLKCLDEDWKNVLRLVKFLRHKQDQFHHFDSFIYKNVFLYLLDSRPPSGLGERFKSYMRMLESFFEKGELNHYYLFQQGIKRNLLKPADQLHIDNVCNFVRRYNKHGDGAWGGLFENF